MKLARSPGGRIQRLVGRQVTPHWRRGSYERPALLERFIEEALRLESPFHGHFRPVRRDTEVAGQPLPRGSRVMLLWGAANRDGDEFPNPDAIDLARHRAPVCPGSTMTVASGTRPAHAAPPETP